MANSPAPHVRVSLVRRLRERWLPALLLGLCWSTACVSPRDDASDAAALATDAASDATVSPDLPPDQVAAPGPDASICPATIPGDFDMSCGCDHQGKIACTGTCSSADETCVPQAMWVRFTNRFLGDNRALAAYSDGANTPFMATALGSAEQNWKLTPIAGGYYRMTNSVLGDARALEARGDGTLSMSPPSDTPGQRWKFRAQLGDYFRVQSALFGLGRSLDTTNDSSNVPEMANTGNYSGQYWHLTVLQ